MAAKQALLAQDKKADSLWQAIQAAKGDSTRLERNIDYAKYIARIDSVKCQNLLDSIIYAAQKKSYGIVAADASLEKGVLFYERGNYLKAIISDEQTNILYEKLPPSLKRSSGLAACNNNLGISYSLLNDLNRAHQYYQVALQQFDALRDSFRASTVAFNMAFLYIDIQDWEKAAAYLQQSINYYSRSDPTIQLSQSMARKAAMLFRLGRISEGKILLQQAKKNAATYDSGLPMIYNANATGEMYFAQKDFANAVEAHQQALAFSVHYKDPYYLVDEWWELGRSFTFLPHKDSAIYYLQKALEYARQYQYLPKVKFILKDLAAYYAYTGEYEKAWLTASNLIAFSDSMVAVQNHNRLIINEARLNASERQQRINELQSINTTQTTTIKRQRTTTVVILIATIGLALLSLLLWRNYRQKQKLQQQRIEQLETEKQLLAASSLLEGEALERQRLAKDLHDGLGGLLSGIKFSWENMKEQFVWQETYQHAFERSLDMLNTAISELRRVAHNMMPESLMKFGLDASLRDYCSHINQTGAVAISYHSIGISAVQIPQPVANAVFRIVQELVNNIVKHAKAKQAIVQISASALQLSITVEDDGKGFHLTAAASRNSMGMKNIESRVSYLQGRIDWKTSPGSGTSVYIEIPLS